MKPIAKERFSLNNIIYEKGDEVEVKTKEQLIKLNERGFIEPLKIKDIQNFGKEPKKEYKKIDKEEE